MTTKFFALSALAGILTAGAASAADLPQRMAPPMLPPVPVFTWTGFYAGINAGGGFSTNDRSSYALPAGSVFNSAGTNGVVTVGNRSETGFVGGGQIGYNYQFTPGSGFVVGFEADAQYADLRARSRNLAYTFTGANGLAFAPPAAGVVVPSRGVDFFGTVRGRLGYAFDRVLVYGTGGFAYGNSPSTNLPGFNNNDGGFRTGWAAGGGVEYALPTDSFLNFFRSSAVTLKVEGLYVNLDRRNNANGFGGVYTGVADNRVFLASRGRQEEFAVVRAGLNYKFGTY